MPRRRDDRFDRFLSGLDDEPPIDVNVYGNPLPGEWDGPSVVDEFRGGVLDPNLDDYELESAFERDYPSFRALKNRISTPERIGTRVGPAIVGAQTGGAIGSVFGPIGTIVGGVLGGAAGGAGGEYLAEDVERLHGEREAINPRQVAMQGALNAIPTGPTLSLGREALKGAGFGLAGAELSALAEDRHASMEELGLSAGLSGGISAALAALLGRHGATVRPDDGQAALQPGRSPGLLGPGPRPSLPAGGFDEPLSLPPGPGFDFSEGEIIPDDYGPLPPGGPGPAGYFPPQRPQLEAGRRYGRQVPDLEANDDELAQLLDGGGPPRGRFVGNRALLDTAKDPRSIWGAELADVLYGGESAPRARQQPNIDTPERATPRELTPPGGESATSTEPGDPFAGAASRRSVDLAGLDPRLIRELGRMVREAEELKYQGGGFVAEDPLDDIDIVSRTQNRPNQKGNFVPSAPQAAIVHALQQLTGLSANAGDIGRRLRTMIETGEIRKGDRLWDAALQLAQARVAGQRHFKTPEGLQLTNPYTGEPINLAAQLDAAEGDWALPPNMRGPGALEQELGLNEVSFQEVEAVADRLDPEFVDRWSRGFVSDVEMRAAIDEANAGDVGSFFEEQGRALQPAPRAADDLDMLIQQHGEGLPAPELVDDDITLNASGESAASAEALSRQAGMQGRGEQFVVYDRAGNRRPLIGPDAVDYQVRAGELYGVEGPEGFRVLDDAGGRLPRGEIVRDVKEALRGPRDREQLDVETESLDELADLQTAIFGEEGAPLANTPSDRRIGRRLEDMLPEGYLDDPATQEWLARLERGEVAERRRGLPPELDDVLDTGELQRRIPGAGGVREQNIETPQIADAPFSLARQANERPSAQGSLEDVLRAAPAADVPGPVSDVGGGITAIPPNVRSFLTKQLGYSLEDLRGMTPEDAIAIGQARTRNPNAPAPMERPRAPQVNPETELEQLLQGNPELAESYERNVAGIVPRQAERNLRQLRRRVPRRDVFAGGADQEANLPASQLGLPERKAPPAGVEAEDLIAQGLREPARRERPDAELTSQEREARGLAPLEKPGRAVSQKEARGAQDVMRGRARKMADLINEPSPQNVDEYVRLLGEQHEAQTKREMTGGSTTAAPKKDRTGEYLASGLGGLEKLYRENPKAFWTIMRSSGGALIGALVDDEDPLRGAALGAVLAGGAPTAWSRLRTVIRTGKLKAPRAPEKDISFWRLLMSPSPERTVPEVFQRGQEVMRELEQFYIDPRRSQSANIAAKKIHLGDLAKEIREFANEAGTKGFKRKKWYLTKLADAVSGTPTAGQRIVQGTGSAMLEASGFGARRAAEPLHTSLSSAIGNGRRDLESATRELADAQRRHGARSSQATTARERLNSTMKRVGESLRESANTIDAAVGRTDKPGLVNQAVKAREMGRKVTSYRSVKQARAALDRLEADLGKGELRVRPDLVESTVAKVTYRTLIGYALDTAAQNLTQPILTSLWVKPTAIAKAYRHARTDAGRRLTKEIELKTLVDTEEGLRPRETQTLTEIAKSQGIGAAAKEAVTDSSRLLRTTDNYNRRVSYLASLEHKGVLDEALRTGRVPAEADAFARMVVRKTQGHTGPLGNNPFQRGPIGGSLKMFQKYPGLFLENVVDALNDPDARGRAAVVALLGAVLAAKASGLDFEDLLVSGGRPGGIDVTQPGSLSPRRLARSTPVGRAISDVWGHMTEAAGGDRMNHEFIGHDLDSILEGDVAQLIAGRYPAKLARRGVEMSREGLGTHQGLTPRGEADPHQASEDVFDLLGVKSTRVTENRRRQAEAGRAVQQSRRAREDTGAEARRRAVIALQTGDDAGFADALSSMSIGQRRAFMQRLGRSRMETLERELPRSERQGFRDEFGPGDELDQVLSGR